MINPNEYTCKYIPNRIKIEGKLDDPAWENAKNIRFFIPGSLTEPISKTEAKILWNDEYLYVGYRAYDKDIWSYFTERDSQTCLEDCLEFFFKPFADKDSYYNFEINALGTVYDALNLKRGAGENRWKLWNCKDLEVAVHINGKINEPLVIDEYWQLEIGIPFASLPTLEGKTPEAGDVWSFHVARYDYSVHLPNGVELSSSAAFKVADFHKYEEWQRLKFVK